MADPVNQLDLADILDVDPKTIRAWVRQGCPVEAKSPKRGAPALYSVAAVSRWREQQAALSASGDLAAMDMEEARRRKLSAEAAIAELLLDQKRGELILVSVAEEEFNACLGNLRAHLVGLGAKVAPRLDIATTTAARREIVDEAVFEALDEISGQPFDFIGGGAVSGDGSPGDVVSSEGEDGSPPEADTEPVG